MVRWQRGHGHYFEGGITFPSKGPLCGCNARVGTIWRVGTSQGNTLVNHLHRSYDTLYFIEMKEAMSLIMPFLQSMYNYSSRQNGLIYVLCEWTNCCCVPVHLCALQLLYVGQANILHFMWYILKTPPTSFFPNDSYSGLLHHYIILLKSVFTFCRINC